MFLIFDTETSNIPQDKLPLDHPDQCHMMQLSCVVLDDKFKELATFSSYCRIPDYVRVSAGATEKHGLTKEFVNKNGVNPQLALSVLDSFSKDHCAILGFNLPFDERVINTEYQRIGIMTRNFIASRYCIMRSMTDVCRLGCKIPNKFKWPKLSEAYEFCFGEKLVNGHDALVDVRATGRILKWMVENNRELVSC